MADAQKIKSVEFLMEVLSNIRDQILPLETEMISSSAPEVKALYDHVHEILQRTESGRAALTVIAANKGASTKLEANGDTVKKLRKVDDAILELEKEVASRMYFL